MVIPAHDEEKVVGSLVSDLRAQDFPPDSYAVWVLADRCSDATAAAAARGGARVAERRSGPEGKGELLRWHLDREPLSPREALVVLDADNRVESDFLARLALALGRGAQVVQASVLPSNMGSSPIATAAGLGDWMAREMIYRRSTARSRPVELGGTGFCVTSEALGAVGGWSGSFTEDLDLTVRLVLGGHQVIYLPEARVSDEKPVSLAAAVGQRRRWAQGRTGVRRQWAGRLLGAALSRRSLPLFRLALRLVVPGRSLRFLAAAALGTSAVVWGWSFPFSWPVWLVWATWLAVRPVLALWRVDAVRPHLVWYPLTLVWGLVWIWVRLGPRRRQWYHTPHHGAPQDGEYGDVRR